MSLFEKAVNEFNETVAEIERKEQQRKEELLRRINAAIGLAEQTDEQCVQNAQGHQDQIQAADDQRVQALKTVETALEQAKTAKEQVLETLKEVKNKHLEAMEEFRDRARERFG